MPTMHVQFSEVAILPKLDCRPVEKLGGGDPTHKHVFLASSCGIEVLTTATCVGESYIVPRGVPYRVQISGRGVRTYTFSEIASGSGLSLSLVSLIMRRKRPISEYAQQRLADFFGVG